MVGVGFGAGMFVPGPARAYLIGTNVTPDCHERMTIDAWLEVVAELDSSEIVRSDDDVARDVTAYVVQRYGLEHLSEREQYMAMSLFVGVRDLDTGGGSALNVVDLRLAHGSTDGQHTHCTRNHDDDHGAGDRVAVDGCRTEIGHSAARSIRASREAPSRQLLRVPFVLDFYGSVDLEVWGPAFLLGRALHGLQDSFSHTLRSDDYRRIVHVMNYTDAIDPVEDYDEARDGLRHSVAMDYCDEENVAIVEAAQRASTELIEAVARGWAVGDDTAARPVLDSWVSYEPGCSHPDYCDSPWIEYASSDVTMPLVECGLATGAGGRRHAWWLALGFGVGLARRRRPRRRFTQRSKA